MSVIRVVRVADPERVSVIDQATGFTELMEVSEAKGSADTTIEDEPDVSGRLHYSAAIDTIIENEPDISGRYHYAP